MEKLVDRIYLENRHVVRKPLETQVRNKNYRIAHIPQIRKKYQRNPMYQQIRPPFP